jgi:acetamidase/formamidase
VASTHVVESTPETVRSGYLTGLEAYALASMAVSFRVTQYANQTGSAYTSIPAHGGPCGHPQERLP